MDNFVEAAKALRGEPHGPQHGRDWAKARVHQTVESMCIALMVDVLGDPERRAAQGKMQATLDDWIPKILAADRGCVALYYGPLIYNVENSDQLNLDLAPDVKSLVTEWRGDLLGGVMTRISA